MNTNRPRIAKLAKAFDQAARANGGRYKPQPTPPPRTYADMTTRELTQALAQLLQVLGTLPPDHATAVWSEAATMQAILASRAQEVR
jgi:hypothetical protein